MKTEKPMASLSIFCTLEIKREFFRESVLG